MQLSEAKQLRKKNGVTSHAAVLTLRRSTTWDRIRMTTYTPPAVAHSIEASWI